MVEAVGEDLVGGHRALKRRLDVVEVGQLRLAVVDDAPLRGEPGKPSLFGDVPAQLT